MSKSAQQPTTSTITNTSLSQSDSRLAPHAFLLPVAYLLNLLTIGTTGTDPGLDPGGGTLGTIMHQSRTKERYEPGSRERLEPMELLEPLEPKAANELNASQFYLEH